MSDELKPEQDAMTPGRRAFEAWQEYLYSVTGGLRPQPWSSLFSVGQAAWEAAAAAVIEFAEAKKGQDHE